MELSRPKTKTKTKITFFLYVSIWTGPETTVVRPPQPHASTPTTLPARELVSDSDLFTSTFPFHIRLLPPPLSRLPDPGGLKVFSGRVHSPPETKERLPEERGCKKVGLFEGRFFLKDFNPSRRTPPFLLSTRD